MPVINPQLTLSAPTPGDSSLTMKWVLNLNDYSTWTPVAMRFYLNDSNGLEYNYDSVNNLKWSEKTIPVENIADNIYTITDLINDESYIVYAMIILKSTTNAFMTIYSPISSVGIPTANPSALTIDSTFNGKIESSNTEFNLKIYYDRDEYTNKPIDKIVIMLHDNALDNASTPSQTKTVEVNWGDLITTNEVGSNVSYISYTLSNLTPNLAYECACFPVRGQQIGNLSNTIFVLATQQSTPPTQPTLVFNYTTGNVGITTTVTSKGAVAPEGQDFFYLKLYVTEGNGSGAYVLKKQYNITSQIYGGFDSNENAVTAHDFGSDVSPTPFVYSIDTNGLTDPNENNIFSLGTLYTVKFTIETFFGETPSSAARTFTPLKIVNAPILALSTPIASTSVPVSWTAQDALGQIISRYTVYYRVNGTTNWSSAGTNQLTSGSISTSYTITGLTKGTKYDFSVTASLTNTNVTPNTYLESDYSTQTVFAIPYSAPGQVTGLTISYIQADVDSQAKLTWTAPTDTSNLIIAGYKIYRVTGSSPSFTYTSISSGPTVNTLATTNAATSYIITGLTNGTTYTYAVAAVLTTYLTNSYVSGETDYNATIEGTTKSGNRSIVPWSLPNGPTMTITDVGNHFVRLSLLNNSTTANGLTFSQFKVNTSGGNSTSLETVQTTPYFTGLNNALTTFTPNAEYTNPNVALGIITATGTSSTATPGFVATSKFSPTSVTISDIGNNTATVSWVAPNYVTSGVPDNLTLIGYNVIVKRASDDADILTDTSLATSPLATTLTITDILLENGIQYYMVISANYDDSSTSGIATTGTAYSSDSSNFTPYTNPDTVTNITYTNIGDQTVTVQWTNPTFTGGVDIEIYKLVAYYEEYNYDGVYQTTSNPIDLTSPTVNLTPETTTSYAFNGLTNGHKYQFYIKTVILNPNDLSEVSSTYATYETQAIPFLFDETVWGITGFDVTGISGTQIVLGWNANTSLFGLPFDYEIAKTGFTSITTSSTSYTDTAVTVGTTYYYKVRIHFVNPNDVNDVRYGDYTHEEEAKPYLNPTAPVGLTGTAGNTTIDLTWTQETTVGGLPVQGYFVYTKVGNAADFEPSDLYTGSLPYHITSLTNGIPVQIKITVQTLDDNVNITDPNLGQTIESDFSSTITVTPFTTPQAIVISVDTLVASSGTNTITWSELTNTGGFPIYGYNIYTVTAGPMYTKLNNSIISPSETMQYIHNELTNGISYTYVVRAVVLNTNTNEEIEGAFSNSVTKIPFAQSNSPVVSVPAFEIEELITVNWTFTNNYVDCGLSTTDQNSANADRFVIQINNLSRNEITTMNIEDIEQRTQNIAVNPGHTYVITMTAEFRNPNDTSVTVSSATSNTVTTSTYGYADAHIEYRSSGNGTIKFAINPYNDIDLKGGAFSNYHVYVRLNNGNTPNVADLIIDGTNVSYVVVNEQFPPEQTISGLSNGQEYVIIVVTETTATTDPISNNHRGDPIYFIGSAGPVPSIVSISSVSATQIKINVTPVYDNNPITRCLFFIETTNGTLPTGAGALAKFYELANPTITTVSTQQYIYLTLSGIQWSNISTAYAVVYDSKGQLSSTITYTKPV
jgi:hypothetical protein